MSEESTIAEQESISSSIHIQQIQNDIIEKILNLTLKGPNSILSTRGVCSEWNNIIDNNLNLTLIIENEEDTNLINYRFNTCKAALNINELTNTNSIGICNAIKSVKVSVKDFQRWDFNFQYFRDILNSINGKTSNNSNLTVSLDSLDLDGIDTRIDSYIGSSMREDFHSFQLTSLLIHFHRDVYYIPYILRYILHDQFNVIQLYIRVWDRPKLIQLMTSRDIFNSVQNSLKILHLDTTILWNGLREEQQQLTNEIIAKFPLLEEFRIKQINCNILSTLSTLSRLNHLTKLSINAYTLNDQLIENVKLSGTCCMPLLKEFVTQFYGCNDGPPQIIRFPNACMQLICMISMPNLTSFTFRVMKGIILDGVSLHELNSSENGRKLLSVMKDLAFTMPGFQSEHARDEYYNTLRSVLSHCHILEIFCCTFTDSGFERRILNYLPVSLIYCAIFKTSPGSLINIDPYQTLPLNTSETNAWIQSMNELSNQNFLLYLRIRNGNTMDEDFRNRVLNQLSDMLQPNLVSITIKSDRGFRYECLYDINWKIEGKERQLWLTIE